MVKTDGLRQWAVSLIICALGGTIISLLSPRGSMEKTLRAVIGIFVVSAVCTPLMNLKKTDSFLSAFIAEANPIIETEDMREQMENVCKNTVGKVIDETLESAGITDYDTAVNMYIDDKYYIIIQNIQIKISNKNTGSASEIQAELQEKLGVEVEVICN